MNLILSWLVGLMLSLPPAYPIVESPEAPEARAARYESIATDVLSVVYDPDESPLVRGPRGRLESALIVLATAYSETLWRGGVETAEGHAALARRHMVDGGWSYCLLQINVGRGRTREGWTGVDLLQDRRRCIRAGYHIMQRSLWACWFLPRTDRLAAYASGGCKTGQHHSRTRFAMAARWLSMAPMVEDAEQALSLLQL